MERKPAKVTTGIEHSKITVLNKVLVTGGTGFLGAWVIRELVTLGFSVRAIYRNSVRPFFIESSILNKVEWVETDILDPMGLAEAMNGVDAIVHAAGLVSFHSSDAQLLEQINIEGTKNVVNVALEQQVNRIVHVSSVAALGRSGKPETVTENSKWDNSAKANTRYARSKYLAEIEVWRGFAEGLTGVIVNPSTIIGYGDWNRSSNAFFKSIYRSFPWYSEGINGFVGVKDCAKAIVALLKSDITEERFILNSENISYHSLFDLIADAMHKPRPKRAATDTLSAFAWRAEAVKSWFTGKKPMLTKETAQVANGDSRYSNEKVLKYLQGFRFEPISAVVKEAAPQYLQAVKDGLITA